MNKLGKKFFFGITFLSSLVFGGCSLGEKEKNLDLGPVKEKTEKLEELEKIQENSEKEQENKLSEKVVSEKSSGKEEENVFEDEKGEATGEKKLSEKTEPKIVSRLVWWGFSVSKNREIDTVIIHSTYNALGGDQFSVDKILDIYKSYSVAPHYLISREGKIYRLVENKNVAYHAGESKMPDGRKDVNSFSLGIEIINSREKGPTEEQYKSLGKLLSFLKNQHKIKHTLGHSDIAPGRKDDPWRFEWEELD